MCIPQHVYCGSECFNIRWTPVAAEYVGRIFSQFGTAIDIALDVLCFFLCCP